jgi:hypothetical protein
MGWYCGIIAKGKNNDLTNERGQQGIYLRDTSQGLPVE